MKFSTFVNEMASHCELTVSDPTNFELVGKEKEIVDSTINIIKPKLDRLDAIELPFIENTFSDTEYVCKCLGNERVNINDAIINVLSKNMFGVKCDELTNVQSNIIKVLVAYIVLQINY